MNPQNTHDCPYCDAHVPNSSEFCGFCGANQRRLTTPLQALEAVFAEKERETEDLAKKTLEPTIAEEVSRAWEPRYTTPNEAVALVPDENEVRVRVEQAQETGQSQTTFQGLETEPDEWDWDEDFEPNLGRKRMLAAGAIALTAVALLVSSFVLFQQANKDNDKAIPIESVAKLPEKPEPPKPVEQVKKPLGNAHFVMSGKAAQIKIGEHLVAEIKTKKGSRYDSVDERAKAVVVRFNHVLTALKTSDQKTPIFVARTNGDRSEVAWQNPNGSYFRVLDITKNDVKIWAKANKGQTSAHVLSNLLADELNAFIESHDLDRS